MYYTHMIVFFVLNIIVNKEMYGWVGFAFCCIVTNILAYVLNTGKFKNCKLLRTLFGSNILEQTASAVKPELH